MSVKSTSTGLFHADIEDAFSSEFAFRNFKLKWFIKDFEFVCNNMRAFESPRFPSAETEKVKWYIRLEPTPLKLNNAENFRILLKSTDNNNCEKHFGVDIIFFSSKQVYRFFSNIGKHSTQTMFWYIKGEDLYRYSLNEDKTLPKEMTIICQLSVFDSGINRIEKPLAVSLKSEGIVKQLDCFYDDQVFKDVKFIVEEKEFNAHKAILAFRSPVFAAMFRNKMSEKLTSTVKIKDIKSKIFYLMLRFIYMDEGVENLEESAIELFYAAEKYQLEKLKKMCLNSMYNNLSETNVVKILKLADDFSIAELEDKAQGYLVSRWEAFKESEEYLELIENSPHIGREILKLLKKPDCESVSHFDYPGKNMFFEFRS